MRIVTVLFAAAVAIGIAVAEGGRVVPGRWVVQQGEDVISAASLTGRNVRATTVFVYQPDNEADANAVQWHEGMNSDDDLLPGSCVEIDPDARQPMSAHMGRDRIGGFARVKSHLLPPGSVTMMDGMLVFRFAAIPADAPPLVVEGGSRMLIRCGPLLRRPSALPAERLRELDAKLFFDGQTPRGFSSYMLNGNRVADPFVYFSITPGTPVAEMTTGSGGAVAAVRSLALRRGTPAMADATEKEVRNGGLEFKVQLSHDAWRADITNDEEALALRAAIAAGFECTPVPCHRRLRSRRQYFRSIEEFNAAGGAANLSASFSVLSVQERQREAATRDSRIITAADVTLTPAGFSVTVSGDELLYRGFDLLPQKTPAESSVDHNGRELPIPDTLHFLKWSVPEDTTLRAAALVQAVRSETVQLGLTYTMAAYRFRSPAMHLAEWSADYRAFAPIDHPLVLTEDCIAGRNTSAECDPRIVAHVGHSRPANLMTQYGRPFEILREYLTDEEEEEQHEKQVAEGVSNSVAELLRCRRNAFGWAAVRDHALDFRRYTSPETENTCIVRRVPQPAFDIDAPVRLHVDYHAALFTSGQPTQADPQLYIEIVPSPGAAVATFSSPFGDERPETSFELDAAASGLATLRLTPEAEIAVTLTGDALLPDVTNSLAKTEALAATLLRGSLGLRVSGTGTSDGELIKALADINGATVNAATVDTDVDDVCGGVRGVKARGVMVAIPRKELVAALQGSGGAALEVVTLTTDDIATDEARRIKAPAGQWATASGLAPIVATADRAALGTFRAVQAASRDGEL